MATWNVNSILARLPRLEAWLDAVTPDVVCLQETKCDDDTFPFDALLRHGYQAASHGDGRWNGVALLSRVGIEEVTRGLPGEPVYAAPEAPPAAPGSPTDDALLPLDAVAPAPAGSQVPAVLRPQARAIGATCGPLRVWSVYVPNGREPGHAHYAYKLDWLAVLRATVAAELGSATDRPFAVAGDFNVAPTDADVWDPAVFVGSTHVTPPEREALAALRATGLTDVFPRALKGDHPFTYWDYRAGMFHQGKGMRIDLVHGNSPFADAVTDAYVDREARKGKGPSDHAPVVVDLTLPAPSSPASSG
jgi:exodeoxyribonuclease-3